MNNEPMDRFSINVPRMIEVRFHQENLVNAVCKRITAKVLSHLIDSSESIDPCEILQKNGLALEENLEYGFTRAGDGLLYDDRYRQHAGDQLIAANKNGLQSASRRLQELETHLLGEERTEEIAQDAAQKIVGELNRVRAITAHRRSLETVRGDLLRLLPVIEERIALASTRKNELRTLIESRSLLPTEKALGGSKAVLKYILDRLAEFVALFSKKGGIGNAPSRDRERAVDMEYLNVSLHRALLEAERRLIESIADLINEEIEIDRKSEALLREQREHALKAAKKLEQTREWGAVSGEILLNGPLLTESAIECLWSDEPGDLCASIVSRYELNKGQNITVATDGVYTLEIVRELEEFVSSITQEAIKDWTVVDAIAAINGADDGMTILKIKEAFRQVASRDFLVQSYEGYLDHQSFAVISYPPSRLSELNKTFNHIVSEIATLVGHEISVEQNLSEREAFYFYIESFCVPPAAMKFFEECAEIYESQNLRMDPFFSPHAEIYNRGE